VTSFHHQPEAQHPKSSAIHKLPADYPIYRGEQTFGNSDWRLIAIIRSVVSHNRGDAKPIIREHFTPPESLSLSVFKVISPFGQRVFIPPEL
jgi:hypothetical protein